tara:strand:+ start:314 stop:1114 length:801 start_codon:yes stop_codon:yes gene_type:complete
MGLHLGQRKLLLTEVNFLTNYHDLSKNVVYIGAAPGHHIDFLSTLFPDHTFYLYDPRDFAIDKTDKILIFQKYFELNDAKHLDNFLLISDIRQEVNVTTMSQQEICNIVMEDMNLQKNWVLNLKPRVSLLKFRIPLFCDSFEYFNGELLEQPWAPESTYETRLIVKENIVNKTYKTSDYLLLLNRLKECRRTELFDHGLPLKRVPGLDNCFDCNLEISIWKEYLKKFGEISNTNISNLMKKTGIKLKRYLTKTPHGKLRYNNIKVY